VPITGIRPYSLSMTPVYNLEVEENHTYYVGKDGVLVHNYDPRGEVSKFMAMLPDSLKERDPAYKYRGDIGKLAEYEQGVKIGVEKAKIIHEIVSIMFDGSASTGKIADLYKREADLEQRISKLGEAGKDGLSNGVWNEMLKVTNLIPTALDLSSSMNPFPMDMTPSKWKLLQYLMSK
ncbi:hypothetical protein DLM77_20865, partial [Leptospira yasudae]